jgi:Flp pilus assembly protein TadG
MSRRLRDQRGQSTVEIIGLLPLIAVLALVAFTVVASSTAHEQAGEAAAAGALALLQGGADPRTAAREALPRAVRARATITVKDRRVHVRVLPRTPLPSAGLGARLAGSAHADAGPPTP